VTVIVVATDDFEVYHDVVAELRRRGSQFTTVSAGAALPEAADAVIVGPGEEHDADVPVVEAEPDAPRRGVDDAMAALRTSEGRTVIGVDPGPNPGIAVLVDDLTVAVFHVPIDDAAATIDGEIDRGTDALVRIGDGARLHGARILEGLDDAVTVELVDETGTTPHLGAGGRGMGDVLAAVNIARRTGQEIEGRSIEPTDGELQLIKNRSRERSPENRTITEGLARMVATGRLTLDEAIAEHSNGS